MQNDTSPNPAAVRIRDNQRRSRARHKEYVEGLQRKIQEHERRGVEATLEMQQAARNVAVENSRLRILLKYRGVSDEEIDKFLQTFPDQGPTEVAKATVQQPAVGPPSGVAAAPEMPLQPLPRPPMRPIRAEHIVPQFSHDNSSNSTRSVVDAIVGIKREPRRPSPPDALQRPSNSPGERRQPLLQPRPQPPLLPVLPAIVPRPMGPGPNTVDKLSVLATASVHQEGSGNKRHKTDELDVPSPPTRGPSPAMSTATVATSSGRIHSTSPRDGNLAYRAPRETSRNTAAQIITDMNGDDREAAGDAPGHNDRHERRYRTSGVFGLLEGDRGL